MKKFKRYIVLWTFKSIHEWNTLIHTEFEKRIMEQFRRSFPGGIDDADKRKEVIESGRLFYYSKMMGTATVIMAGASFIASFLALIVAAIALFK